jgi:hypothetical protein
VFGSLKIIGRLKSGNLSGIITVTISAVLFAMWFHSCRKDQNHTISIEEYKDTVPPIIEYLNPLKPVYNIGSTVKINIKVTDEAALKTIRLHIINTTIDSVYFDQMYYSADTVYIVSDNIQANITTLMADFLVITTAFDKANNKTESIEGFHVMD